MVSIENEKSIYPIISMGPRLIPINAQVFPSLSMYPYIAKNPGVHIPSVGDHVPVHSSVLFQI